MQRPSLPPVNPKSDPCARALLADLYSLQGRRVLSGQHNTPRELSFYSDQAEEIGGRYPAVWGQDFGFAADGDMDGMNFRQAVVDEAVRQHAAGSVITLMWHAQRPTEDGPATFTGSICAGPLGEDDWSEMLTPGTEVHGRWCRQVDEVAEFLAQLHDANVPVLWRPYHEMNGNWFWWGGRPGEGGYAELYRMLYDRLTILHGLDNLVWVFNPNARRDNAMPYEDYYPGHAVVDVLAADVYGNAYGQDSYGELLALAEGRPIALGEVGVMPTPEILAAQPMWCWFMTWTTFLTEANTPDAVRRLFSDPRVLNRTGRS